MTPEVYASLKAQLERTKQKIDESSNPDLAQAFLLMTYPSVVELMRVYDLYLARLKEEAQR